MVMVFAARRARRLDDAARRRGLRRGWVGGARCARRSSASASRATASTSRSFDTELSFRGDAHDALAGRCSHEPGGRARRCAAAGLGRRTTSSIPDVALGRSNLPQDAGRRAHRPDATRRSGHRRGVAILVDGRHGAASTRCSSTEPTTRWTQLPPPASDASPTGVLRGLCPLLSDAPGAGASYVARCSSRRERGVVPWRWRRRRPAGCARAARSGASSRPAVRLQRRRERPLRPRARSGSSATTWNPHYFVNPPAYTYLLHLVLRASGSAAATAVAHAFATRPDGRSSLVARVVARCSARPPSGCSTWPARGSFDRRVGLLAAALLAVAFLPVFYCHLALNDVPTLAPLCAGAVGRAGVLRDGPRRRLRASRASGSGSAARRSTRAGSCCCRCSRAGGRTRRATGGAGAARAACSPASLALAAFLVANPYALLDCRAFSTA